MGREIFQKHVKDKELLFSTVADVLRRTSYDPRVQNRLSVRGENTTTCSKGMDSISCRLDNLESS